MMTKGIVKDIKIAQLHDFIYKQNISLFSSLHSSLDSFRALLLKLPCAQMCRTPNHINFIIQMPSVTY